MGTRVLTAVSRTAVAKYDAVSSCGGEVRTSSDGGAH